MTKEQLDVLIKKNVKELLAKAVMKMRAGLAPVISDAEQEDIEKRYGRPSRRVASSHTLRV